MGGADGRRACGRGHMAERRHGDGTGTEGQGAGKQRVGVWLLTPHTAFPTTAVERTNLSH